MVLQSVSPPPLQKIAHILLLLITYFLSRRLVEFPSLFNHLAECVIELLARITVNGVSRRCNYLQCPPLFIAVRCLRVMKTRLLLLFVSLKVNGVIHDDQSSFYHVALSAVTLTVFCFRAACGVLYAPSSRLKVTATGNGQCTLGVQITNRLDFFGACSLFCNIIKPNHLKLILNINL